MQNVAPVQRQDATIFESLGQFARRTPQRTLALVALASGAVALLLAATGAGYWMLLAACYVVWSFAAWGLLLGHTERSSAASRAIGYLIVISDSALVVAIGIAAFYWALGPRWVL